MQHIHLVHSIKIKQPFADITMFSFDPIKTITALDGGAVVVNTKEELNELKSIRQLGFSTQPNVAFYNKKKLITD